MKKAFNICAALLIAMLIGNQAVVRAQAGEARFGNAPVSCTAGAERVRADARDKGFSAAASGSQGERFLSNCLITGGGLGGHRILRD